MDRRGGLKLFQVPSDANVPRGMDALSLFSGVVICALCKGEREAVIGVGGKEREHARQEGVDQ